MQSIAALTAQASASNPIRYASCSRASHQPACIASACLHRTIGGTLRRVEMQCFGQNQTYQRPHPHNARHMPIRASPADPGEHPTAEMHAKRGGPLLQRSSVGTAERVGSEQPILEAQVYRRRPVGRRRPRRVALREVGEERMRKRLHGRAPKSRRSIDPSARGSNRVCACAAVAGRRARAGVPRAMYTRVHGWTGVCSARHAHRREQELPVGEALSAGAEGRGGNGGGRGGRAGGGGMPLCWIECEQLREQVERTCAPQRSHAARCAKQSGTAVSLGGSARATLTCARAGCVRAGDAEKRLRRRPSGTLLLAQAAAGAAERLGHAAGRATVADSATVVGQPWVH